MTLPQIEAALARSPAIAPLGASGTSLRMAAEALLAAHADLEAKADADRAAVERLRTAGGPGTLVLEVPFLKEDVHDLDRLAGLGRYLTVDPAAAA